MCLFCDYNKPKITTGDIVCYKIVKPIKGIRRLFGYKYNSAVYRKFKWKLGKIYYQKFVKPEVAYDKYTISIGFHGFLSIPNINWYYSPSVIVKCIIPKGTRYFRNSSEIVAERMMIVEEI